MARNADHMHLIEVHSIDWQRFQSLFLPGARLGEAGAEENGKPQISFRSVDEWLRAIKPLSTSGTNREVIYKMRVEQFGNIASVFYSHSAIFADKGKTDDVRRVNLCQMPFDGRRWWVTSVIWNDSPKKWDLPPDMEP